MCVYGEKRRSVYVYCFTKFRKCSKRGHFIKKYVEDSFCSTIELYNESEQEIVCGVLKRINIKIAWNYKVFEAKTWVVWKYQSTQFSWECNTNGHISTCVFPGVFLRNLLVQSSLFSIVWQNALDFKKYAFYCYMNIFMS